MPVGNSKIYTPNKLTTRTPPKVDFSWSPVSVNLTYTVNGNTYPYAHQQDAVTRASDSRYESVTTPTNTELTFVAVATPTPGSVIIEYRWDFGDGIEGYGIQAKHTYLAPNPSTVVTLTVTDSKGLTASCSKALVLVPAAPTRVRLIVRPSPS